MPEVHEGAKIAASPGVPHLEGARVAGRDEDVALTHVGGALSNAGGSPADRAQGSQHVCM